MKIFIIICLFLSFLFAEYPVAKFGYIKGEINVLRHGKLLKAFNGFKIDEYDVLYPKSYTKADIVFNNGYIYKIKKKTPVNIKKLMDEVKITRVKTKKELHQKKGKEKKFDNYKYNSKFYKQRFKSESNDNKNRQKIHIDSKKNIYILSETKDVTTISDSEDSSVNIGNLEVDTNSDVKNIIIKGRTENIKNISRGKGSKTTSEVGSINVQ